MLNMHALRLDTFAATHYIARKCMQKVNMDVQKGEEVIDGQRLT
jgi:hypothetical protein